ncbi:HIT domain-containing protein, partial [Klebsiella pneumoniae]|nr:HIT domain-containing protein [Klebsiella pneumoniae]
VCVTLLPFAVKPGAFKGMLAPETDLPNGVPVVFALDQRLQQDTLVIGDFPLCRLLLSNDSNYPWFILVPRINGISEVFQLDVADQH